MQIPQTISIVIPTFQREQVLIETIEELLNLDGAADELIIVDQTARHSVSTESKLAELAAAGAIRLIKLPRPSIPAAMNVGLRAADSECVLFLDDDIIPDTNLVRAHLAAFAEQPSAVAVVGQVLQPGEAPVNCEVPAVEDGLQADLSFPFRSTCSRFVHNVMAGNLAVRRHEALAAGGFDENFVGSAYRFETEFCRRLIRERGPVLFAPAASIRHLRVSRGGTRVAGSHLNSPSPVHGVGDYYFALRSGLCRESVKYILKRPIREVTTRYHLRHPWYIPVKLVGECRALMWAIQLVRQGPQLIPAQELQSNRPSHDGHRPRRSTQTVARTLR